MACFRAAFDDIERQARAQSVWRLDRGAEVWSAAAGDSWVRRPRRDDFRHAGTAGGRGRTDLGRIRDFTCGSRADAFIGNIHTERGNELEPAAREEFSRIMGLEIVQVGFITRDDGVVGLSPDALILKPGIQLERDAVYDDKGAIINAHDLFMAGLEAKAPVAKNHAGYIVEGGLPKAYFPQVHFSMAATRLPWYFIS